MEESLTLTFPLLWGGGRGRGTGASSAIERPPDLCELASSCKIGPEILMGALFFLLPPLRSDFLDRSSDMVAD